MELTFVPVENTLDLLCPCVPFQARHPSMPIPIDFSSSLAMHANTEYRSAGRTSRLFCRILGGRITESSLDIDLTLVEVEFSAGNFFKVLCSVIQED